MIIENIQLFQTNIRMTSTPKRSNKSYALQPLSSTLSTTNNISFEERDLSISAIPSIKKYSSSHKRKARNCHHHRKRIDLKDILYLTPAMKHQKQKSVRINKNDFKIYIV